MTAFSQVVIGEVDVNRRLLGLEKAGQSIVEMAEVAVIQESPQFLIVLYSVLFLSASVDLAIREQACAHAGALLRAVHRAHGGSSHPPCVERVVLPWIRKQLAVGSRAVLQAQLALLRECVVQAPAVYSDWSALLSSQQPERDFFLSVCDPSPATRCTALKALRKALRRQEFRSETVIDYLVPLVQHCLFDLKAGGGGGGGGGGDGGGREAATSYRDGLVQALQSLARLLPWWSWTRLCVAFAERWDSALAARKGERAAMHLFCALADAFPFEQSDESVDLQFVEGQVVQRLQQNILEAQSEQDLRSRNKKKLKDAAKGARINVEVVVVLVRLLQKLPEKVGGRLLPPVLRSVCNSLAEQDESIRDATRKTIAKISVALGPK